MNLQATPALLVAIFVAACTSTERQPAVEGASVVADREAPQAVTTTTEYAAAGEIKTVDMKELANAGSPVICRDVLKMGSNVLVTYCMTPEGWKAYERRQAQEAQEILRMLQGSPYR
ncbi:MAG TPA: hypothetical protein VIN61_06430 [Gammaproteobacteria bacterium]